MSVPTPADIFRPRSLAEEIRATLGTPGPADSPYSAEMAECYAVVAQQLAGSPDPELCSELMGRIIALSAADDDWRTHRTAQVIGGER